MISFDILLTANKGITPINLVRLGILKGSGEKLLKAARFRKDYDLLSPAEITALHKRLVGLFKTLPDGPFQALCEIVGEKQARVFASRAYRQCTLPHADQNARMGESSNRKPFKRPRLDQARTVEIFDDGSD
jgi:hypothetical protein